MDVGLVSIPFKREGAWKVARKAGDPRCSVRVSIPFKREGAWKARYGYPEFDITDMVSIPFKREGAWKVFEEIEDINLRCTVSIPFKREGAWKARGGNRDSGTGKKFQFPSNGKEHGKWEVVSFSREGDSGFNSLQTGRSMESFGDIWENSEDNHEFQFPSNGKEHGKNNE